MLLVITDVCSRWTAIFPLKKVTSKTIFRYIKTKWIEKYGSPTEIISDQGRQFISKYFTDRIKEHGIKHVLCSTYNPTGNSIVERVNQSIGNVLRCSKHVTFKEALERCRRNLNYGYHSVLGTTPYAVISKHHPLDQG
jgi:transposase InsO family protein